MKFRIKPGDYRPIKYAMGTERIGVNSRYFTFDGNPVLPVMGEFHFSRYPAAEWRTELAKMQAGGVQICATYVFWIYHEEERGVWNFEGNFDLRRFVTDCAAQKMPLVLRVGPFAHGECRNGGLPDWMVADKGMMPRTDDPAYLKCVKAYFEKIGEQISGLTWDKGGPIIGIQLENEYGHVGGPSDRAQGEQHMRTIKRMADEAGITAPMYTATGWGGAYIIEGVTLPVQGGYVDAPWAQHINPLKPTRLHLFEPFLDAGETGSDWKKDAHGAAFNFDPDKWPFLTAELGGGIQVTHHRRTYPTAADIESLTVCRLGSGANLIGYYMYHGGVHPSGKLSDMQESRCSGFANDLPIRSYDFFAPLRESGEASESYGRLRKHLIMLNQFGGRMAPGACVLPEGERIEPEQDRLRACVRYDSESGGGFVFVSNHQRGIEMSDRRGVNISLELPDGKIELPQFDIASGDSIMLPFNFDMDGAVLRATNAQPLCRLGKRWFFWCDGEPVYDFASGEAYIETLTRQEANCAYLFDDELYISDALLYKENGVIYAQSEKSVITAVRYCATGDPETIEIHCPSAPARCEFKQTGGVVAGSHATAYDGDYIEYDISADYDASGAADMLLDIAFDGDRAELYAGGKLAADWFNTGTPWRTALKRLDYPKALKLRIYGKTEEVYADIPFSMEPGLRALKIAPVYRARV